MNRFIFNVSFYFRENDIKNQIPKSHKVRTTALAMNYFVKKYIIRKKTKSSKNSVKIAKVDDKNAMIHFSTSGKAWEKML